MLFCNKKLFGVVQLNAFNEQNNTQQLFYNDKPIFLNILIKMLKKPCLLLRNLLTKICCSNDEQKKCENELCVCQIKIINYECKIKKLEHQLEIVSEQYLNRVNNAKDDFDEYVC